MPSGISCHCIFIIEKVWSVAQSHCRNTLFHTPMFCLLLLYFITLQEINLCCSRHELLVLTAEIHCTLICPALSSSQNATSDVTTAPRDLAWEQALIALGTVLAKPEQHWSLVLTGNPAQNRTCWKKISSFYTAKFWKCCPGFPWLFLKKNKKEGGGRAGGRIYQPWSKQFGSQI